MATVHTYPVNDLIEHETTGDDCVCGPRTEFVTSPDGGGCLIIHESLDGREHNEAG